MKLMKVLEKFFLYESEKVNVILIANLKNLEKFEVIRELYIHT